MSKNKLTTVRIFKWDVDWLEIKNLCRTTISMADSSIEPTDEWKLKLLLAEHSPIRDSAIGVEFIDIPSCIATHICRHHEGIEKFQSTNREDRTGIDRSQRSQTDPVNLRVIMNVQGLINISRKRLCQQADPTTRAIWEDVVDAVSEYDPVIASVCVPEGIRDCGCPELFGNCQLCPSIIKTMNPTDMTDMRARYQHYNEHRAKVKQRKKV